MRCGFYFITKQEITPLSYNEKHTILILDVDFTLSLSEKVPQWQLALLHCKVMHNSLSCILNLSHLMWHTQHTY